MQRKRMMIAGNLVLGALAAWSTGSGTAAKACEVSQRSSYGSLMNSVVAAAMAQQATEPPATITGQAGSLQAGDDNSAQNLVGLWQVVYTSGGQVVDQAFEVWHSDGTEEILDITPPAEENACFGVWVQTNRNTVRLKHPTWTFDPNGNLTGTAILRETVTLERGENKFTGRYTLDYYDIMGNSTGHFTGDLQGTRITVD
jgi:hypothetical protein